MRQERESTYERSAPKQRPVRATWGKAFPDGTLLELAVSAGKLRLLYWNGQRAKLRNQFARAGRTYVPAAVNASTLRAVRFPSETKDYGSTELLFRRILDVLKQFFPLPDRELSLVAHWILASWFPDVLPMAPTLVISGPSPAYVARFLRLLRCLCRRGLRLAELNLAGLCALPMKLQPTLLVEQTTLTRSMSGLFRASSSRGVYISRSGDFLDLHCVQALFSARNGFDAIATESALRVAVVPAESGGPSLSERAEQEIAAEFQPLLLEYRLRNRRAVSQSVFDVPEFTPGLRDLARGLGAAIVDAPELSGRLVTLLGPQDAHARACRTTLPEVAIITVALALVHEAKVKQMLVKGFAQLVNAALRANGEIIEYSPEEVGWRLSRLGLYTHRMVGGNGIRFDRDFSRSVHDLARNFGVEMVPGSPACPDCPDANKVTELKGLL